MNKSKFGGMPRIGLKIAAELENLASFDAVGEDFRWFLKINCGNCGETTDWVYVSMEEEIPVKGIMFLYWEQYSQGWEQHYQDWEQYCQSILNFVLKILNIFSTKAKN